jgi:membrane-associated phospholipid phosphatase
VTYLAYRNLKSVVPLIRPGDLFDRQLADLDRSLFGGHDPAALLHELLGTGVGAHFMSGAYMIFFAFIPGTLAIAVVFARNLQPGLFYVTAQSINWLLAAGSYFLLPSLGPVYLEPSVFADLPSTAVGQLQELLLDQRIDFLRDPAGGAAQSIGAFSSLHVSFFFTAALTAHLLGLARPLRIGAWVLLGLTTAATIYLGWHYVLDDLAGVVLGAIAILLARALTGLDLRTARRLAAPETTWT